jgi:hypothetical protein
MNITSVKYMNDDNKDIVAIIDGVELRFPCNEENRHYQAIQEWVAEGNTIEEAD